MSAPRRPRVVVVGNGMAGARVVDELRALDPGGLLQVTVLGEESVPAYNRVLLSEVLAGRHRPDDIALSRGRAGEDDVRLGLSAVAIDRDARLVHTGDGGTVEYDVLVLATGSRPFVPPVDGLLEPDGTLVAGAHAFRTLDDCRDIEASAREARRAVVLGGGLLGLEAARGLAGRGLQVVVVHNSTHLMERQLDPSAGRVLRRTLATQGVSVRLDATTVEVVRDDVGRLAGVLLDDGGMVLGDLLVVACGVRPEVSLARSAGLLVERGVVVDDRMRSVSDDRIYAIGECAQHAGEVCGLVAPAWEQAAVAARHITGTDPDAAYSGSPTVTRLKASGVDLAAMGESVVDDDAVLEDPDAELVVLSDPSRGTYGKLVLRHGRVTGAILVGVPGAVGTVTQLFDRGSLAPVDRAGLLFPGRRAAAAVVDSPSHLPRSAQVCRCNGVTKGAIQDCVLAGAVTVDAVAERTRATTGCGGCRDAVAGIVDWVRASDPALGRPATTPAESHAPVTPVVAVGGERRPV